MNTQGRGRRNGDVRILGGGKEQRKGLIKTDEIKLTGKRLRMAELLANPEFRGTNKALYEAVGISHDTFYKWIKDDEILSCAEKLVDKYTDAELGAVWKALIARCKIGDVQAIKLYFELKGRYNKSLNISGVGIVQIVDDIPAGDIDDEAD